MKAKLFIYSSSFRSLWIHFQVATQKRLQRRVFSANAQHPLMVTFHRAPSTGQSQLHVCWPTWSRPIPGLDFCFHLHFFLVLPLYLVYIALLFCYMCKLFQIACERKQRINKQDPMILHVEIFRGSF